MIIALQLLEVSNTDSSGLCMSTRDESTYSLKSHKNTQKTEHLKPVLTHACPSVQSQGKELRAFAAVTSLVVDAHPIDTWLDNFFTLIDICNIYAHYQTSICNIYAHYQISICNIYVHYTSVTYTFVFCMD